MNRERPSRPPISVARTVSSGHGAARPGAGQHGAARLGAAEHAARQQAAAIPSGAIKVYRDEALLDRAFQKLEIHARRPAQPRMGWQAAAALLLFGGGVGVGLVVPNLTDDLVKPEAASVTAEATRMTAGETNRGRALEVRDARARPTPPRAQKKRSLPTVVGTGPAIPAATDAIAGVDVEVVTMPASDLEGSSTRPGLPSNWLELAAAGDYAGALGDLERSQLAQVVLATGSVEELMTMAEVARFAGNQERAIQALSLVVDRYAGDPNAPLAAMMLGNLLSRSGDAAGAARAFALNRTLSPGGDFAEDSLVREFDLALAAGNVTLASSLFDQYAREFPAGPRVYAMRYELDELVAQSAQAAVDAEAPPSEQGRSEQGRSEQGRSEQGHSEPAEPEKDERAD